MTFPALLLFVFAPVLGLLVRVRDFAVVAALVCAVSLSVGESALAQSGGNAPKWRVECKSDGAHETCYAWGGGEDSWNKGGSPGIAYHCKNTAGQEVNYFGVYVYSLAGATEAIAEAKRRCGF